MKNKLVNNLLWLLSLGGIPSIIPWAFESIRKLYNTTPRTYCDFLISCSDREVWIYRFFAAYELGTLYRDYPIDVLEHLISLSDSKDEIVREGCARSWSVILRYDFERGMEELQAFVEEGDYEERYTAAIAPVRFYKNNWYKNEQEQEDVIAFWEQFENDSRQGIWNIVRTQILGEILDDY